METLKGAGTKACSNGPYHITAMPVYGKKHFKIFYGLGIIIGDVRPTKFAQKLVLGSSESI